MPLTRPNDVRDALRTGAAAAPANSALRRTLRQQLRGDDAARDLSEANGYIATLVAAMSMEQLNEALHLLGTAWPTLPVDGPGPDRTKIRTRIRAAVTAANTPELREIRNRLLRFKRTVVTLDGVNYDDKDTDPIEAEVTAALATIRLGTDEVAVAAALQVVEVWRGMTRDTP